MADVTLGTVLRHLRRAGAPRPGDALSDGQLLDGFVRQRDETAFAALLSRHGPMVLGVCRRVLRQPHDAEDAFQATFLVLVRQADSVRRRDSLASWLYGVALRTARRARLDAARRRLREERAAVAQDQGPADEPDWRDLRAVLDEEIAGLPEKYRGPLVLCHLEGQTNAQAARRLRVPLGSLSKRLARARGLLRGRLLRRGVALSAAALGTVLAGQGGAAVPPLLARTATGTALLALAGGAGVPAPVAALAGGVARALFLGRVRAWLPGLVALGLLIGGGLAALGPHGQAAPTDEAPARPAPAVAREEAPAHDRADLNAVKRHLFLRNGGNAKSEAAVAAGLAWLAKQQAEDGHWSLDGSAKEGNDTAGTAFGLLPLLGAGYTPEDGKFATSVRLGLAYLTTHQGKDGGFTGGMYAHGLATCALCQAYALTGDPKLAAPARAAVDYIVKAQHTAGGWRYEPGQPGDLSVTAWQVAALGDARAAGLDVPRTTRDGAAKFVQSCRAGVGYSYLPGVGTATPTMTAAGLLSSSCLGRGADEAAFRDGVHTLAQAETPGAYYLHWAAGVLRRHGGDDWHGWNAKVRDALVTGQQEDGGWPAAGDPYAAAGGRLMVSSLTLLTLEVYYRDDLPLAVNAPRPRTPADLEAVWSDLAADSATARRAVWALARSPHEALPLLERALTPQPRPAVNDKQVARLIAGLDDDDFDAREQASAALAKLGAAAGPALRRALKESESAEVRRRLEALLAGLEGARFTSERQRLLRAVEVLEYVGTPEARRVLRRVVHDAPEADLARAAEAALRRLGPSFDRAP